MKILFDKKFIKLIELSNHINRSEKSIFIAAILSLFFGVFGLQNVYLRHKKIFLINMLLFAISAICFLMGLKLAIPGAEASGFVVICALCFSANVYWGLIDFIRILSGHARDAKGAYLLTNTQYKKYIEKYQIYFSDK